MFPTPLFLSWCYILAALIITKCAHFYIQSIYVAMDPGVSVCLCVSVCPCHLYSPNGWTDFDDSLDKSPLTHLRGPFFSVLKIQIDDVMMAIIAVFECRHFH